ncbi:MAG: nucleotidyltransferase domain-containing protein [Clostridia bacterium]|nr:nucleotidyltransferase domain-containing protein [Clostridia bacterium]
MFEERLRSAAKVVSDQGYFPVYISLHGSQNYGLAIHTEDYQSDFDFKCIVLPSLRDLVEGKKPTSLTIETQEGQIDIKDIRVFVESVGKMNPAYLECLATQHFLTLAHEECFSAMKALVPVLLAQRGAAFARACQGLFMQKEKQMCHPFPAAMEKIIAYGYDGKQVHHMYRLLRMLQLFAQTGKMQLSAPQDAKALLTDLKLDRIPLDEARRLIEGWKCELKDVVAKIEREYPECGAAAAEEILSLSHETMLAHCRYEAIIK